MRSFAHWLTEIGLENYASVFAQNEVDFSVAHALTDEELRELGLSLGARKKFLLAAAALANIVVPARASAAGATPSTASPAPSAAPESTAGERRQLTVMFCDLVGSTALSEKLDPEELRSLLHEYRTVCGDVISRYEGFVARYVGDGILTYFGWPKAHEEDAERALRAALEIVQAVKGASSAEPLSVRIGIATGTVVVGEQAGAGEQSKLAVGSTPNLAARLQGLAAADQIVIASSTRRLVGNAFELSDLGDHELKGIAEPVHAWRVMEVSAAASRFEAATHGFVTPLVGREQEIGLLLERWQLAQEGEGQVVLLSGEPGIGKSRILNTLRERLEDQGVGTLRFQCSPYYVNSALYPTIDNWERALKFGRDASPESKLDKLEALMVGHYRRPLTDVRFIAALLSIPCEARYGAISITPQKQKDETLRVLVDIVEAAAHQQPTAMLYEDAHWADPTSLEAMDLLVDRVSSEPLLIVLTYRPEFQPKWGSHGHVTALNLSKLTRAQSGAIVSKIAGGKALPDDLLERILAKTDGVPLYVEEITKAILESGELKDAGDHYHYVGTTHSVTIPATLRDSLTARLDRSPAAKEIAQVGAAIGREFSYELIAAVARHTQTELDSALNQLIESGLAFRRGTPPEATYTFKHALVLDAAYDSLLKGKRRELHVQIAEVVRGQFSAQAEAAPELLAHHYTEGGSFENAVHYWRLAAERAAARFATPEAIAHARQGLAIVAKVPADAGRNEQELALRIGLIASLRMADRLDEALQELDKAESFASQNERIGDLARLHHLRGNVYFPLGKMEQCLAEHQKSLEFARMARSTEDEARAEGGLCDAYYMRGQMRSAHEHVERCIELCRAHGFEVIETAYLPMRATTHQYALRFAEALADCRLALDMAERIGQPRAKIIALNTKIFISLDQHDFAQAEEDSRKATELMEKIGARRFLPLCNHGIALARLHKGDRKGALELLETSMTVARETGITFWGPIVCGVIAMASSDPTRRQEALRQGQALLDRGCVSHNYFWFYRDAIEVSLAMKDWDRADQYATALDEYFRDEPVPSASFIIEQCHAVAELGRGRGTTALLAQIERLRGEAARLGMRRDLALLEAALQDRPT